MLTALLKMFKFDFSISTKCAPPNDLSTDLLPTLDLHWISSKELLVEVNTVINKENTNTIYIGQQQFLCTKPPPVNHLFKSNDEQTTLNENISLDKTHYSDLIPSKYEGGFKIWECTLDIASFMLSYQMSGKTVLDLGCGVGVLGILAMKQGAEVVHFQDYNDNVLQLATVPNVQLNVGSDALGKCRFFSGDWSSFAELVDTKYDFILTSETIYNPDNMLKLHNCIQRVLKPSGTVLLGAKSYYFGVGGSTHQFRQLVHSKGIFENAVVWRCSEGVQREILLLKCKQQAVK